MKILDRIEELIVIVMLALMTLLTFLQVVMRYGFNSGFPWALELSTVFFAAMIFVGMSYGVRTGAHIGVDALGKRVPPCLRRAISIIVVLLCLLYAGLVIYGSWVFVCLLLLFGFVLVVLFFSFWF